MLENFNYLCFMDKFKNAREYHKMVFEKFGINSEQEYEVCVEQILYLFLDLNKKFHETEKQRFREQLYKVKAERRN